MAESRRSRRPNFTSQELSILVESVHNRREVVFGYSNNGITNIIKNRAWDKIAEEVNAVSGKFRTVEEVRKKWMSLKSATKKKAAVNRKKAKKTDADSSDSRLKTLEVETINVFGHVSFEGIDDAINNAEPEKVSEANNTVRDREDSEDDFKVQEVETALTILQGGKTESSYVKQEKLVSVMEQLKRKKCLQNEFDCLLQIEKERLEIESKRLEIDEMRLKVESERLLVERKRLQLEERRWLNFK